MDTTTALIYDAVHLFALALHELNMIQDININSLDCTGEKSWEHGSSLINYMKLTTFNGLSGMIQFDSQGKVFQNTSKNLEVGTIRLVSRLIHSSEVQLVYLDYFVNFFDDFLLIFFWWFLGLRTNFALDVLELQATGLEPIGTWSVIDSLNLTRMVEIQLATNPYNGVFLLIASNLTKERVPNVYSEI